MNEAQQIMLDHDNITSHRYPIATALTDLQGNLAWEYRLTFQTAFQSYKPKVCLVIDRRLSKLAPGHHTQGNDSVKKT